MSKMEKEPLFSAKNLKYLTGPFSANNPVIVQILGICSALAVTVPTGQGKRLIEQIEVI